MMVTRADIIVVVVCLLVGYFSVSWLVGCFSRQHVHRATGARPGGAPREKVDGGKRDGAPNSGTTGAQDVSEPKAWYEVLGVPPYASLDEVKRAYRQRISEYHPDKTSRLGGDLRALAEAKTKDINAAYEVATRRFKT